MNTSEKQLSLDFNGEAARSPARYVPSTDESRSSGRPSPGRKRLRWAVGLAAASAAVVCLPAALVWLDRELMQVAAKNVLPNTTAASTADKPVLPDSGKLKETVLDGDGVEALKVRAREGNADAQYLLGKRCSTGDGVPLDKGSAVAWYQKAAEQGLARAQAALGVCYARGEGVPEDFVEAAKWFRKAAEQGDAKAQRYLGLMYATGRGLSKDSDQAFGWLAKAATQGEEQAKVILEHMNKGLFPPTQARRDYTIRTCDGKTYSGTIVCGVELDGLKITYKPAGGGIGVAKIGFENLPADLQQKYGYDKQKAVAYRTQQAAGARQSYQKLEALRQQEQAALNAKIEADFKERQEAERLENQRKQAEAARAQFAQEQAQREAAWLANEDWRAQMDREIIAQGYQIRALYEQSLYNQRYTPRYTPRYGWR